MLSDRIDTDPLLNRYQDYRHERHGCLRVMNEDRVNAHTGFGTHSHKEFEIFSYVVDGELEQCVLQNYFVIIPY